MHSARWLLLALALLALVPTAHSLVLQSDSTAISEPVSEPETSPKPESSPEPEPQPEGEPESEPEPEGETSTASFAEPEPEWDVAKEIWGSAWEVHLYLFGSAFGVVALYSLFSVLRLWKRKHLLSQKYFISLNLLVFLMGAIRAIYLLIDGYNSNGVFPELVAYMLYTLFLPCVTSTFSLLFLSLLAATRMRFISPSIQNIKVILCVIFLHFTLAIVTDVLTVCHLDARVVLFICQLFYIVWGLFLFIGFMYIFGRLYKAAIDRQHQMNKYALKRMGSSNKQGYKPENHKLTLSLGTIVTLISSILGLLTVILLIYGMADVYGVFEVGRTPEPWRWWGYHTCFRSLELAICITVSYVATQPFRYSTPTRRRDSSASSESSMKCANCIFFCAPCWSWFQREQSSSLPEWSQLHSEMESSATLRRNESVKSENHIIITAADGDNEKTTPDSPGLGETIEPKLASEHAALQFSSEDRFKNSNSIELDNLISDQPKQEQTTLQVACAPLNGSGGDKSEALELSGGNGEDEADALVQCNVRWSEQSLDKISQMSPEIESGTDDEMSGLLIDV